MITDDERREVARRLRDVEKHAIPDARISDNPMTVEFIAAAAFYDLPYVRGFFSRLADLIEPSIPADPGEAGLACVDAFIREHTEKPVDRDALLALADEMQGELDGCESSHEIAGNLQYWVDRIRDACGEVA